MQKSSSHKGWEIDMIMSSFVFLFMAFHCLGLGLLSQILLIESDTASAIWRVLFFYDGDPKTHYNSPFLPYLSFERN